MSRRANPTVVGAFIVGALAILALALLAVGSGVFRQKGDTVSVFFGGSVRGLNPGSEVTLRGVKVGEVKQVFALVANESLDVRVEVLLEVDYSSVRDPDNLAKHYASRSFQELTDHLISVGLRATLETASLLTGQRYINLDFYPGTEVNLTGLDPRYPELPTHRTSLERVGEDLQELVTQMRGVPVDTVVQELSALLHTMNALLSRPSVQTLPDDLAEAAREAGQAAGSLNRELSGAGQGIQDLSRSVQETASRMDRLLAQLEVTAGQGAPLGEEVGRTLEELQASARAIRILAEYLELHPEALLTGKEAKR